PPRREVCGRSHISDSPAVRRQPRIAHADGHEEISDRQRTPRLGDERGHGQHERRRGGGQGGTHHWPAFFCFRTSTVPASPSTTTQSPVSMTSSGSRSKSVTLGTRMTTAPSAILVVISLKTSAFGAVPASRAV